MRPIDADALIKRIVFHSDLPFDQKEVFEDEINAEPSIELERPKGKWIPQDHNKSDGFATTLVYYFPQCSECGHSGDSAFVFLSLVRSRYEG